MRRICFKILYTLTVLLILSVQAGQSKALDSVTFDVACDSRTFVLNRQDSNSESILRGDTFVLNGKIFPGGMIPEGGTKSSPSTFGPDHTGSVGVWFSRGTFLVPGDQFSSEKIQRASTHYFVLSNKDRIISEGFEGSTTIYRVVVGGMNSFEGARGTMSMIRLGINKTGGHNLRFVFTPSE